MSMTIYEIWALPKPDVTNYIHDNIKLGSFTSLEDANAALQQMTKSHPHHIIELVYVEEWNRKE